MPSLQSKLMKIFLRLTIQKDKIYEENIIELRQKIDMGILTPFYPLPKEVSIKLVSAGGVAGEWVIPPRADPKRVIYYLHGGGYCFGSCNSHRLQVAHLSLVSGMRVLHINYRLAPEHPFPDAVEDCFTGYRWLLNEQQFSPSFIAIGGDSAGGMFTLTTLLLAKERGLVLPGAAFCFSPHTDFTFQSESISKYENQELFFSSQDLKRMSQLYKGSRDPKDPLLSPLYADLKDFPPLLIHVADPELLRDDGLRLAAYAQEAGVTVELKIWKGMFHAFQLIPYLPESKKAMAEVSAFINRHLQTAE